MSEGVSFTPQAAAKIVAAVRRQGQQGLEPNYPEKQPIQRSHYGPYIAIAQEDIDPNASGSIKLAAGATKGSETAYGDAFDAYYRTSSDGGTILSGAYLYAFWISGGWEISPVECPA